MAGARRQQLGAGPDHLGQVAGVEHQVVSWCRRGRQVVRIGPVTGDRLAPATGGPVRPRLKVVTLWPRATPSSATARDRNTVPPNTRISIAPADQTGTGRAMDVRASAVEYLAGFNRSSCSLRAYGDPMPIATPEIYNEMLDRAKAGGFAYPAINCTSSETINAALKGFADAGSDGIIQFSTGGAEFGSGTGGQGHGDRRGGAGRVRPRGGRQVPDQRRAAHRPLPEGQAGQLRPAAAGDLGRAGPGRAEPAVPVAHVGRLRGAAGGEPADRGRAAEADARSPDHPRGRDRRGRRRGGRRRQRDQRQALHHRRGLRRHR